MIIQFQRALVDSLQKYSNVESNDQLPTPETAGMIVGLTIGLILMLIFFVLFVYFFPWWRFYDKFCWRCVELPCCNCIRFYYLCPCMDTKAFLLQQLKNRKAKKMFIQDLFATADGRIIHTSDIRPCDASKQVNTLPRNICESDLI